MDVEIDQTRGDPQSADIDSTRSFRTCVIRSDPCLDPAPIQQQIGPERPIGLRIQQYPTHQ